MSLGVYIQIMENKQPQPSSKQGEIAAARFFRVTQILRTCCIPYPLVMAMLTLKSTFYILPLILNVYSQRQIDSIFTNVIFFLEVIKSALQFYLADVFIASLIMGGYVLITVMFFAVFISIARGSEKGEPQCKKTTTIFCIMSYLLYSLIFPLTFVLSMLVLKQLTVMPLLSIISAFVLLFFSILGHWIQGIVSADLSGTTSLMAKVNSWHDGLTLVLKMFIANLTVLDISVDPLFLGFILLTGISFCLLELYQIIFSVKFYHTKVQNIYTARVLVNCVVISISFLVLIFPDPMIMGNLTVFHAAIFILGLYTLQAFLEHRGTLILLNPSEIKTEGCALVYILQMVGLATRNDSNSMIKPFLISNHLRECRSSWCFCRNYLKEQIYKLAKDRGFMDKLVLSCLQQIKTKYAKSLVVFSLCLNYKIIEKSSLSRIKHTLKQLAADHLSIYQRYLLFQLEEMVDHQIREANHNRDNLPLQNIIRQSASLNALQDHLVKITEILASKYRLMSLELVRLNQVAAISDKINVCVRSIQAMWQEHSTTANNYNIEIDFLFLYYFQAIIPSYRQAHELKRTLLEKTKKMSNVKGLYRKNALISMHSKRTCVLESVFDDQTGFVSNASKSVAQVLNVERDQIIGKDIHKFMPAFFAKGHQQVLSNWLTNESFNILKKGLVDCFTADKNHIAFSALTYLKVHSDGRQLKIYKMVIRDNDRDFLILRKCGAIEAIGSRLNELGVVSDSQLNQNFMKLTEQNFLQRVKDNEKEWILVRPFKNQRKSSSVDIVSSRSFSDEERDEETAFQCWVVKKQQLMGDYSYIVIQFLEIRRGVYVPTNIEEEFRQSSNKILKSMRSIRDADGYTSDHVISRNDIQEDGQFIGESSSCQTSSEGKKGEYSKLVLVLKEMTCNPAKIRLKWRLLVTIVFLFILASGVTGVYFEKIIFQTGFSSFSDIAMAGRNISSTHQFLQMLYNNALMAQAYCPQQVRCQKILQSSSFMLNQFYSSYSGDLQEYFKEVAKMSGMRLSSSYNLVVSINLNKKMVQVSSHEFMEYYYQWLKTVQRKESSSEEVREAMDLLSLNWETLKSLSKQTISFYSLAGQQQLKSLLTLYIVLLSIICLFVSGLFVAFKAYINYRAQQKTLLLDMYKRISRKIANIFQEYFTAAKERERQLAYPSLQGEHSHQGIIQYQKQSSFGWFVPILLILPSFLLLVTPPLSMFSPASTTFDASTALIESQNHLLESYFQLKAFYMGYNFSKSQSEIQSGILIHLNQTQIELGTVVRTTFPLFEAMDASFGQDFNQLLTENVCDLTSSLLSEEVSEQCKKVQDVSILARGVMTGMNFLQRTTMKALIALRSSNDADKATYFTTIIFQDMDDYLIYLFRVNQLMSLRVIEAFREKIPSEERLISLDLVLTIVAGSMMAIFWLISARGEKNQLSDLCGYALQIPEPVLVRKHVLKHVKEILGLTSE